jgi:amyloid beta precursor protein binding protein 1
MGNAKIHNVAAFLGGVAAQEACKLLMSQYVPLNNTFIWDGISG